MPELITCPRCGAQWSGLSAAHCCAAGCGRVFSTVRLFDAHRHSRGEHGGCLDPATITNSRGERIMFHRAGAWRGPELTEEQKTAVFSRRIRGAKKDG